MIFATGDTHKKRDIGKLNPICFTEQRDLTKDDYVIVLGDWGALWNNVPDEAEMELLNWYNEKPWTTLFLGGNHENYNRIEALPEVPMFGDVVGKVTDSIFHLKTGHVYNIDGKKFMIIGGGESIDRHQRIDQISWWPQELLSYDQQNLVFDTIKENPIVDYVLTHTCPTSIFDSFGFNQLKRKDPTMKILEEVKVRLQFDKWFFGHFHVDRMINKEFTCLYNGILSLDI